MVGQVCSSRGINSKRNLKCEIRPHKAHGFINQKLVGISASGLNHEELPDLMQVDEDLYYYLSHQQPTGAIPSMVTISSDGRLDMFIRDLLDDGFKSPTLSQELVLPASFRYPITACSKHNTYYVAGDDMSFGTAILNRQNIPELHFVPSDGRATVVPDSNQYSFTSLEQFRMIGMIGGSNPAWPSYWSVDFMHGALYSRLKDSRSFIQVEKLWEEFGKLIGFSIVPKSEIIAVATEHSGIQRPPTRRSKTPTEPISKYKISLYKYKDQEENSRYRPSYRRVDVVPVEGGVFDFGDKEIKSIVFGRNSFGFSIVEDGDLYAVQSQCGSVPTPIMTKAETSYRCLSVKYLTDYGSLDDAYIASLEERASGRADGMPLHRVVVYHIQKIGRSKIQKLVVNELSQCAVTQDNEGKRKIVDFDVSVVLPNRGCQSWHIYAVAAILFDPSAQEEQERINSVRGTQAVKEKHTNFSTCSKGCGRPGYCGKDANASAATNLPKRAIVELTNSGSQNSKSKPKNQIPMSIVESFRIEIVPNRYKVPLY